MRELITQTVVTNDTFGEASASSTFLPVESSMKFSDGSSATVPEVGCVETRHIDVAPVILPGNFKIDLRAIASQYDFSGYEQAQKLAPVYITNPFGKKITPSVLPLFNKRQATSHTVLYDSQTLVLFPQPKETVFPADNDEYRELMAEHVGKAEKQNGNKVLIALVTVTLMDAAGNRIHSDDEMSFAQNRVPPQTP